MNPLIKSVLLAKSIMRYPIVVVIRHCWKKKKINWSALSNPVIDKLQKISSDTSITSSNLQIER